ncbi:class I SAM-dependent methyltransferase, partial [Mycobacterium colombiense]|uniref:class I SAM-dependent methyltransferase n=1 Tax=Mycobacterium colombiense TaxID=339268 RepID=UPI000A68A999
MSGPAHTITHVSDTARWTALHRATETARPDALFNDHLAERLAGEHGRAIADNVRWTDRSGWWLVARTKLIDDAIADALAHGCDRVLNLAAGLDTRPYRLDLPPDLTWIEADLPKLLAEKTQVLADQAPRCRLNRIAVDLADPHARDAFFNEALDGATKAFVLTEGLSMYLEASDVAALSGANLKGAFSEIPATFLLIRSRRPGKAKSIIHHATSGRVTAPERAATSEASRYIDSPSVSTNDHL